MMRWLARGLAPFALALFFACGSADRVPLNSQGARASCTIDSDCIVTDAPRCCMCCKDAPVALPVSALAQRENRCKTLDCPPCGHDLQCPTVEPPSAFVAKCREGTCAAVHIPVR